MVGTTHWVGRMPATPCDLLKTREQMPHSRCMADSHTAQWHLLSREMASLPSHAHDLTQAGAIEDTQLAPPDVMASWFTGGNRQPYHKACGTWQVVEPYESPGQVKDAG